MNELLGPAFRQENDLAQTENEYLQISSEINDLISSPEKDFENNLESYIKNRLQKLELNSTPHGIGAVFESHAGFIHPDCQIYGSMSAPPFKLDDPEIYKVFLNTAREFKQTPGWDQIDFKQTLPITIQYAISRYFGNAIPQDGVEAANQNFYFDKQDPEEKISVSISQIKNKNIAVCAEKAAVAQNLLTFAGLESELVIGKITNDPTSVPRDDHYYNIFKLDDKDYIFDPTNPEIMTNTDNSLHSINPSLYPISKDEFHTLRSGNQIEVNHDDINVQEGGIPKIQSTKLYFTRHK